MAYSFQTYVGDGSTTDFSFSFPYISEDHIKVTVQSVDTLFDFVTPSIIRITPAPANGDIVVIQRVTPTKRLVDYTNGSIQDAEDFDLDSTQLLYLIEESRDKVDGYLSRLPTEDDNLMYIDIDMNGSQVKNLGTPVDDNDAVRKIELDNFTVNLPDATESTKGVTRIATQAEANAGVNDFAYITALKLKTILDNFSVTIPDASETVKGIAEIATQAEADAGTDDARIITALKLKTILDNFTVTVPDSSETEKGIIEIATQAETDAGTDDTRAITPLKLETRIQQIPAGGAPTGSLLESFGTPSDYLEIDGSTKDKTTYGDLYAILGDNSEIPTTTKEVTGNIAGVGTSVPAKISGVYVARSVNDGVVYSNDTGATWNIANKTGVVAPDAREFSLGGGFLTIPSGIAVNYSSDGINWFRTNNITAVANIIDTFYINGFFYAIDTNEVLYKTDDPSLNDYVATGYIFPVSSVDHQFVVSNTSNYMLTLNYTDNTVDFYTQSPDGNLRRSIQVPVTINSTTRITINEYSDLAVLADVDTQGVININKVDLRTGVMENYVYDTGLLFSSINDIKWVSGDRYCLTFNNTLIYTNLKTFVNELTSDFVSNEFIFVDKGAGILIGGQSSGSNVPMNIHSLSNQTSFILPEDFRPVSEKLVKKFIKT